MIKHEQMKTEFVNIPDDEFVDIQWDKISPEYVKRYKINKLGQVKDLKTGKLLKITGKGNKDYPVVTLRTEESRISERIHLLIANTFLQRPNNTDIFEVDHINRDSNNYSLENLRFVTRSENKKNRYFSKTGYSYFKLWIGYTDNTYTSPVQKSLIYEKNLSIEDIKDHMKSWNNGKAGKYGLFWRYYFTNEDDLFDKFEFPTVWKQIPDTQALCSNCGLLLLMRSGSKVHNVITSGYTNHAGYKVVNLNKSIRRIHRLVFMLFGDVELTDELIVDHIDTNRANNRIENLRAVKDQKENLANETSRKNFGKKVKQYDLEGNYIATFQSCTEAYRTLGLNPKGQSGISEVCKGNRLHFLNYLWCYEGEESSIPAKVKKFKAKTKTP